jgi:hypothetical protein
MIFHRDVEITGQVRDHKKENDEGLRTAKALNCAGQESIKERLR